MEHLKSKKRNLLAIISLVIGIIGFMLSIFSLNYTFFFVLINMFLLIIVIIFGHLSIKKITNSEGKMSGKGKSIICLVFGYIGICIIFVFVILPMIMQAIYRYKNPPNYEVVLQLQDIHEKKITQDILVKSEKILSSRLKEFGIIHKTKTNEPDTIIVKLFASDTTNISKKILKLFGKPTQISFHLVREPETLSYLFTDIDSTLKCIGLNVIEETDINTLSIQKDKELDKNVTSVEELFGLIESNISSEKQISEEHPLTYLLQQIQGFDQIIVPNKNVEAVEKILQLPEIKDLIPDDYMFIWSLHPISYNGNNYMELFYIKKRPDIKGSDVKDANLKINSDGNPLVNVEMDEVGSKKLSYITGSNIGKNLAIVMDNKVLLAPNIENKINNGKIQIHGFSQMKEAEEITIVLRSGTFPVPIKLLEGRKLFSKNND